MPAQPEYVANITLPSFTNPLPMLSLPPNSAVHVCVPFLVVSPAPAPSHLTIKPQLILAAIPAASDLVFWQL